MNRFSSETDTDLVLPFPVYLSRSHIASINVIIIAVNLLSAMLEYMLYYRIWRVAKQAAMFWLGWMKCTLKINQAKDEMHPKTYQAKLWWPNNHSCETQPSVCGAMSPIYLGRVNNSGEYTRTIIVRHVDALFVEVIFCISNVLQASMCMLSPNIYKEVWINTNYKGVDNCESLLLTWNEQESKSVNWPRISRLVTEGEL